MTHDIPQSTSDQEAAQAAGVGDYCDDSYQSVESEFIETLALSPIQLDVYHGAGLSPDDATLLSHLRQDIQNGWPVFWKRILTENIPQDLGLKTDGSQQWEAELNFVDNELIQTLNADYRQKDQATDVLSFCLFADQHAAMEEAFANLPVIALGSIFVSIPWAKEATKDAPDTLRKYVLERVFHGFLHLLGAHHDTMPDYERVKSIQNQVLEAL